MKTIVSALGPFASLYLFASAAAAHEPGSGHQQPHLDVGTDSNLTLNGRPLPNDFIYGCGVSAYQIEGAWNEDGKGVSIWDEFAHEKGKGHIKNDETGDVAMDFYHTYHQDIPLFVDSFGISAYDYTISWPRILPNGRGDKPNAKGVEFYHNVNEATHKAGATASCTLYHWDLPATLQKEYGGWLNKKILDDFENYARVAMTAMGKTCDRWVSMNEPRTFCTEGYSAEPESAPGHKGTIDDVYTCMHHALLAHGRAYKVYKELETKGVVHGGFGIKLDGGPGIPFDPNSDKDKHAVRRHSAFEFGWQLRPLTRGDYPTELRDTMGDALPHFTKEESAGLKDSYDLIYFDSYTSTFVKHVDGACTRKNEDWPACLEYPEKDVHGKTLGNETGSDWNYSTNSSIYQGLHEMHDLWGAKAVAVGETGLTLRKEESKTMEDRLNDVSRINWYHSSLTQVDKLLQEGVPVKGFVFWSCISNLEWSNGYEGDFGLIYAQHGKNQPRHPKKSAAYMKGVFREGHKV